jgi:DNA-binding transcriptional MerR regulator
MSTTPDRYTLEQLCGLVELPVRTVRYYIQIGLLERPAGAKRGAYYTRRHLDQLLEIRKWQQAGLSLERIRELLGAVPDQGPLPPPRRRPPGSVEVWSHLLVRDGIELHIEPTQAGLKPEQMRALLRAVLDAYERITGAHR